MFFCIRITWALNGQVQRSQAGAPRQRRQLAPQATRIPERATKGQHNIFWLAGRGPGSRKLEQSPQNMTSRG